MSGKGLHLVLQEEIQRLKRLGLSLRNVSRQLGLDRKTVRKYWNGVKEPYQKPAPDWVGQVDWDVIKNELKDGITREVLYKELSERFCLPNYQNFCKQASKRIGRDIEITVKISRLPGESLEVDYAGESISILNPATGEVIETELFVSTLSFSKKIYAEFTLSQKLEDWTSSHNRMFKFYGGVSQYIICDNLKSGVTKACKLDPLINKTYHDLCRHYDLIVDPADSYKARHKPNVEKAVDVIQRGFMQLVRNKTYTSLHALNRDLWAYLKEKNSEVMPTHGASRDELFEKEKAALKALPDQPYKLFYWKLAKVHADCHIQLNYNYYSIPHRYVGRQVEVKFNQELVKIFIDGEQVAVHNTLRGRGNFSTLEGHYPDRKIVELQINYQRINQEAKNIGENMASLIHRIFNEQRFPLKRLRRVQGIIALKRRFSHESLEYAASQALHFNRSNYRYIEACAKSYRKSPEPHELVAPLREQQFLCLQGGKDNESI